MARALSAVDRREYVCAVIRITRHQGRPTTAEAMNKLGLSRATVQRYFSEAEATGEVVRNGRLGLFRDQSTVIDFDMKRLGMGVRYELQPAWQSCIPAFPRYSGSHFCLRACIFSPGVRMIIVKTHTGTVITKDGPKVKKLHQTERMWVVGKNEFYHKESGRRHFAENTRRRLLLDTIKPIEEKHV